MRAMKAIGKIGIIGRGALGIMYADALSRFDVRFIADEARRKKYDTETVTLNGRPFGCTFASAPSEFAPDLIVFAVKSGGLDSALRTAAPFAGRDTVLLSVMNGITSEDVIGAALGRGNLVHCVVQGMDTVKIGADVRWSRFGRFHVGITDPARAEALSRLTAAFDEAGVPYTVESDIMLRLWSKFMLNVGVNQVCHAYKCGYGAVMRDGEERRVMIAAMREVLALANAEGVGLTERDIDFYLGLLAGLDPGNMPSMRQDGLEKRRSEVDIFAGEVIRRAEKLRIPVPVNEELRRRIEAIDEENASA